VGLTVLCTGFAAALAIYLATPPVVERDGERPEDSKQYLRQMQVYGGTANVLAAEAREWLEWLSHGRGLAVSVACLTVLAAAGAVVGTTPLPARDESERAPKVGSGS
jgi:hypothetical protein